MTEVEASAVIAAIRTGDVGTLARLLRDTPGLATERVTRADGFAYPLLHATTDWPGNFPRVAESIALLVAAGADVEARCAGANAETALHFAASCDDVAAVDALVVAGADIETEGAVIAGGTPLDDAVAFAQWKAARRLVDLGAITAVWHAAALGLVDRIEAWFASGQPASRHPWGATADRRDIDVALWCAAHGGQRAAAELLLARGANPAWRSPWDRLTPIEAARRSGAADLVTLLT